jgi:hypothetical protein
MDCAVAPFDQVLLDKELEVRTTFPPRQKVVGPEADTVGVGMLGDTVTVVGDELDVQPLAPVWLTV